MKRAARILVAAVLCAFAICTATVAESRQKQTEQAPADGRITVTPAPRLLITKLDSKAITQRLPLSGHKWLTSGAGKKKQWWTIKGVPDSTFEIIGNNQSDADNVGWSCSEFDKAGNRVKQTSPDRLCHAFFVKVLDGIVDDPQLLARRLIEEGEKTKPQAAWWRSGDISIESDGEFYFVRRWSRMLK